MLIRISGGSVGIKEYLEDGQKQGRDYSRDELDKRLILEGDIELMDEAIKAVKGNDDRFLHITLSFKEDNIDEDTLKAVTNDFKEFAMSAYRPDEYSFYAEAHLPKIKTYLNKKTGLEVERKPHIHIVIPKINLLSGDNLSPLGYVTNNIKFVDSIQEKINQKYGLASPKDNRRMGFNDGADALSRYTGDAFKGSNKELRSELLKEVFDNNIGNYDQFKEHLKSKGEVKVRNPGTDREYLNIKVAGAEKGVNLKDYVFSKEFLNLNKDEKISTIEVTPTVAYVEQKNVSQPSVNMLDEKIDEWHSIRAREIKYLQTAGKEYKNYVQLDNAGKLSVLSEKEAQFYSKNDEANIYGTGQRKQLNFKHGFEPVTSFTKAKSWDDLRSMSSINVVSHQDGDKVLLSGDALLHMDNKGTDSDRGLRWNGAGALVNKNPLTQSVIDEIQRSNSLGDGKKFEIALIKKELDASRLLARLSQTHGVVVEKYSITKSKDGADRIKAGKNNYNVSDFLTKEMNLPWNEAKEILVSTYQDQSINTFTPNVRNTPSQSLWEQFRASEQNYHADVLQERENQRLSEMRRKDDIRRSYAAEKEKIRKDELTKNKNPSLSAARIKKIAEQEKLKSDIKLEREQIRDGRRVKVNDRYKIFLSGLAEQGDTSALRELRRLREKTMQPGTNSLTGAGNKPKNTIRSLDNYLSDLDHTVSINGDVTYRNKDGVGLLRDSYSSVDLIQTDNETLATGLMLAAHKFGNHLKLNGSDELKARAVNIVAARGLHVTFADDNMNKAVNLQRQENKQQILGDAAKIDRPPQH